jgi:protein-L-isoaspartate(D-aspartate) O-methyltransferase
MNTAAGSATQTQRDAMVADQIAGRGIRAARVLDALRSVPRELFVPDEARPRAYTDRALAIDCRQTISQPYIVARMTELLELAGRERVLEIGSGSGYQTAVLALLASRVYTVEWHLKLLRQAAERLELLGIRNVTYRCGDGSCGWPEMGPFDAILCAAGAPEVPVALREQLAPGGRLVLPVGSQEEQTLVRVTRGRDGWRMETLLACRFVRLVGRAGWCAD